MAPKPDDGISLGTDRQKILLSILVEAEISRGEGFRKFQPETEIFRSFSIDAVPIG